MSPDPNVWAKLQRHICPELAARLGYQIRRFFTHWNGKYAQETAAGELTAYEPADILDKPRLERDLPELCNIVRRASSCGQSVGLVERFVCLADDRYRPIKQVFGIRRDVAARRRQGNESRPCKGRQAPGERSYQQTCGDH
jgi:hypothetical protein